MRYGKTYTVENFVSSPNGRIINQGLDTSTRVTQLRDDKIMGHLLRISSPSSHFHFTNYGSLYFKSPFKRDKIPLQDLSGSRALHKKKKERKNEK